MLRCEICPCGKIAILSRTAPGYDGSGDANGVGDPIQVIKIATRELPALFLRLPAATQAAALAFVWRQHEERWGRRPLPIRLPAVRTKLAEAQR